MCWSNQNQVVAHINHIWQSNKSNWSKRKWPEQKESKWQWISTRHEADKVPVNNNIECGGAHVKVATIRRTIITRSSFNNISKHRPCQDWSLGLMGGTITTLKFGCWLAVYVSSFGQILESFRSWYFCRILVFHYCDVTVVPCFFDFTVATWKQTSSW